MANQKGLSSNTLKIEPTIKRTSIGGGKIKTSSMNKHKRRCFKKYRGQGR
jgi:hypothetical protein